MVLVVLDLSKEGTVEPPFDVSRTKKEWWYLAVQGDGAAILDVHIRRTFNAHRRF